MIDPDQVPEGVRPLAQPITSAEELYTAIMNCPNEDVREAYLYDMSYSLARITGLDFSVQQWAAAPDYWWMIREHFRRNFGIYQPVSLFGMTDNLPELLGHNTLFLHHSKDGDKLIAYTPDASYGRADRRVKVKLGKFLTKHFHYLGEDKIREIATMWQAGKIPFKLHWAAGAEDIARVYNQCEGAKSCMVKPQDFWGREYRDPETNQWVHPTAAYDSPDIGVAYVTNMDNRIVARAVVNLVTQQFVRIYGHTQAMLHLLREEADITTQGGLNGARLKRVPLKGNRLAVPYLDGDTITFDVETDCLKVKQGGAFARPDYSTAAITVPFFCTACGKAGNGTATIQFATEDVCSSCIRENKVVYTERFIANEALQETAIEESQVYAYRPGLEAFAAESGFTLVEYLDRHGRTSICRSNDPELGRVIVELPDGTFHHWKRVREVISMRDGQLHREVMTYDEFSTSFDWVKIQAAKSPTGQPMVAHYVYTQRGELDALRETGVIMQVSGGPWFMTDLAVEAFVGMSGRKQLINRKNCVYDERADAWVSLSTFENSHLVADNMAFRCHAEGGKYRHANEIRSYGGESADPRLPWYAPNPETETETTTEDERNAA